MTSKELYGESALSCLSFQVSTDTQVDRPTDRQTDRHLIYPSTGPRVGSRSINAHPPLSRPVYLPSRCLLVPQDTGHRPPSSRPLPIRLLPHIPGGQPSDQSSRRAFGGASCLVGSHSRLPSPPQKEASKRTSRAWRKPSRKLHGACVLGHKKKNIFDH